MSERYEHSISISKPSSESHAWSYRKACIATQEEIEIRHGADWKITSIIFEDKGRTTQTDETWDGKRSWKCTHTVIAVYQVVHRFASEEEREMNLRAEFINIEYKITYKMMNVNQNVNS